MRCRFAGRAFTYRPSRRPVIYSARAGTENGNPGWKGSSMKRRMHILQISVLLATPVLLHAQAHNWSFTKLATLGDPAHLNAPPAGSAFHINDFEPGAINNQGDVVYGTDLGTSADPSS